MHTFKYAYANTNIRMNTFIHTMITADTELSIYKFTFIPAKETTLTLFKICLGAVNSKGSSL